MPLTAALVGVGSASGVASIAASNRSTERRLGDNAHIFITTSMR
jgi:hypothetical protein